MNSIIKAIIHKEFLHIVKDKQTFFIVLLWPVLMLIFFGYAITMEMRFIPTIITDNSRSPQSRELIRKISANNFFRVKILDISEQEAEKSFQQRAAKDIIIIPQDFAKELSNKKSAKVQVLIDASDPNLAMNINNYLNIVLNLYNKSLNPSGPPPLQLSIRFLYNNDLKSAYFFVPGLTAIIMLMLSTLLTSIAIVKEKEQGSMEQILVSPITPLEIVIGKVIPYVFIAFFAGLIIILTSMLLFHVPMEGSFLLALSMMLLYVIAGSSLGILISSISSSQQAALLITLVATMLPTTLLSGFMFPIKSMPILFQYLSNIIPATHFVIIIRGIMLKGSGVSELLVHIIALALIAFILLLVSIKKLKASLE